MPLTIQGVGHTFNPGTTAGVLALENVSLSLEPGEFVLVVGETGSGKSTLLRIAAGLISPSTGSATVDGVPLGDPSLRGTVGLVFQDAESQLFADSVLEDVAFGPRNLGLETAAADLVAHDALCAVGLDPGSYASRSPFSLSGGEARRAAIAGVLAMRPIYLLADEPTSALDAEGRRAVRDALRVAKADAGVMVVSHSPEEFLDDADRVLILHEAGQSWYGDRDELLCDPSPLCQAGLAVPDVVSVQLGVARRLGVPVEPVLDVEQAAGWLEQALGGWQG